MKRISAAILFAAAIGCGGSESGSPTKNLANFQGATWNGQVTTAVTCTGLAIPSQTDAFASTLSAGTGADLQTTVAGCEYKFNVSGNTASLANGPVTCAATVSGIPITATWTTFTLTTSDGHTLAINAAGSGTASALGLTCPFAQTGTATR